VEADTIDAMTQMERQAVEVLHERSLTSVSPRGRVVAYMADNPFAYEDPEQGTQVPLDNVKRQKAIHKGIQEPHPEAEVRA